MMKLDRLSYSFLLLLCLLSHRLSATDSTHVSLPHLERFTLDDGLPDNRALDIVQDAEGIMWIATHQGICHFDGMRFEAWDQSIGRGVIPHPNQLLTDRQGHIWMLRYHMTGLKETITKQIDELYIFDPVGKSLRSGAEVLPLPLSSVIYLQQNTKGDIYISTQSGQVYRYTDRLELYKTIPPGTIFQMVTSDAYVQYKSGRCELGFRENPPIQIDKFSLANHCALSDKLLLFGAHTIFDHPRQTRGQIYSVQNRQLRSEQGIFPKFIESFAFSIGGTADKEGNVVLFNSTNIYLLDKQLQLRYRLHELLEKEFGFPKINAVYIDEQNNYWICLDQGIAKFYFRKQHFHKTYLDGRMISTRGIHPLTNGKVYVNSYSGNYLLDPDNNPKEIFLRQNFAYAIHSVITPQQTIWTGIHGPEIWEDNPNDQPARSHFLYQNYNSLLKDAVLHHRSYPLLDKDQRLWVVDNLNLFYYDPDSSQFKLFFQINKEIPRFNSLQMFDFGKLWICGDKGIIIIDKKTQKWEHHFVNVPVQFVHQDQQNPDHYWLGTSDRGLLFWDKEQPVTKEFNTQNSLSNNSIHCIFESNDHRLWFSSNFGLTCFDKDKQEAYIFYKEDGLPDDEFNRWSGAKAADGSLLFGSVNGIVHFQPEEIALERNEGKIQLRECLFRTQEKDIPFQMADRLDIPPAVFQTEMRLFLPDYRNTQKTKFQYRIKSPQSPDISWTNLDDNKLIISQRQYGNYLLEIRARNGKGQWLHPAQQIPLVFAKPFFLQYWFFLLIAASMLFIGFLVAHIRLRSIKKYQLKLEKIVAQRTKEIELQKEQLEKLNQTKDTFFTIIAHDLRSPIIALRNFPEKIRYLIENNQVYRIDELGKHFDRRMARLNVLLDNLLAWSLKQKGHIPYEPERISLRALVQSNIDLFESTASIKQIGIINRVDPSSSCFADVNALSTILRNLISNAIKYSFVKGRITLEVEEKGQIVKIKVMDQGVGISKKTMDRLLSSERIPQTDMGTKGEKGNGLGLLISQQLARQNKGHIEIESEKGKGCVFCICLPRFDELNKQVQALDGANSAD
ncbi:MAG: ATP-binding protein [Bacteroidota bacterium]